MPSAHGQTTARSCHEAPDELPGEAAWRHWRLGQGSLHRAHVMARRPVGLAPVPIIVGVSFAPAIEARRSMPEKPSHAYTFEAP